MPEYALRTINLALFLFESTVMHDVFSLSVHSISQNHYFGTKPLAHGGYPHHIEPWQDIITINNDIGIISEQYNGESSSKLQSQNYKRLGEQIILWCTLMSKKLLPEV